MAKFDARKAAKELSKRQEERYLKKASKGADAHKAESEAVAKFKEKLANQEKAADEKKARRKLRMGRPDFSKLTRQQIGMLAGAGVVFLISFGLLLSFFLSPGDDKEGALPTVKEKKLYFVDIDAKDPGKALIAYDAAAIPPVKANIDGEEHTLVRAYVFSCGACVEGQRFTGYVEQFTEEGQKARRKGDIAGIVTGQMIKPKSDTDWFRKTGVDGVKLIADLSTRCSGAPPKECHP